MTTDAAPENGHTKDHERQHARSAQPARLPPKHRAELRPEAM